MNFIAEFRSGQKGKNRGLSMGKGLANVDRAIGGIQKKRILGVAAPPKAGKSTFVDDGCVISPILDALERRIPIELIYFSLEIDRVSKEFDFVVYFLYNLHGISHITLEEGVTYKGQSEIELSPNYLRGRIMDDNGEVIVVNDELKELIREVHDKNVVPLMGKWNANGEQVKKGIITFIEAKDNPTGYRNFLIEHASKHGEFIKARYGDSTRIVGYKPKNPDKFTIIVFDHLRKLVPERGFQMKQTVDKMIEYMVEFRNWCDYTFIPIIHTNRNLSDVNRQRFSIDIYPTSDDIKDTGNLAEDADYIITIFNPNDNRYNLKEHFNLTIRDSNNEEYYPFLRTVHLVESRHCEFPQHFVVNMRGNLKSFEQFTEKYD